MFILRKISIHYCRNVPYDYYYYYYFLLHCKSKSTLKEAMISEVIHRADVVSSFNLSYSYNRNNKGRGGEVWHIMKTMQKLKHFLTYNSHCKKYYKSWVFTQEQLHGRLHSFTILVYKYSYVVEHRWNIPSYLWIEWRYPSPPPPPALPLFPLQPSCRIQKGELEQL